MKHITVPVGYYHMKHYRIGEMVLTDHDGTPGHPPATVTEVCESDFPAGVCSCRDYLIIWGSDKQ